MYYLVLRCPPQTNLNFFFGLTGDISKRSSTVTDGFLLEFQTIKFTLLFPCARNGQPKTKLQYNDK